MSVTPIKVKKAGPEGPFTVGSYSDSRASNADRAMLPRIEAAKQLGLMVRDRLGNPAPIEIPPGLALAILDLAAEPSAEMFVVRQKAIDGKAHP